MEIFLLISLVVIFIYLYNIRHTQKETAEQQEKIYRSLKKEIQELKKQPTVVEEVKQVVPEKEEQKERPFISYKVRVQEESLETTRKKIRIEEERTEQKEPVLMAEELSKTSTEQQTDTESFWDKWMRNNPDLEKFIGENLINKIGIGVLVLGIAFFVKYAIDQDWINETGRVCIGIVCGIILIGIAHRLRNSYRSFSSVMAGGGIAVFYFTIAFAFHEYQLFTQTTAFIIMIVITAFAVALALLSDKLELAVIAVIGGFLVPFLVSNGSNNYVALFTYLLVLNTGMLIIAYFKKWPVLHVITFYFTLIIFGAWLLQQFFFTLPEISPYRSALFFASAFYIIFLTTVLIHNLKKQKPFKAFDFSFMIMITASYYGEGMLALAEWDKGAYAGSFTIILAGINLVLAWFLHSKQKGEKNLLYLLIGFTATFLSLAAPVQLHGHSITLFWSAEAVLLFWLYQRSHINTFKYFSAIILVCMLFSLSLDWSIANQHNQQGLAVIFTGWQGIVTNIIAIVSLGLYSFLLRKTADDVYIMDIQNRLVASFLGTIAIIILYTTCFFSINLYFIDQKNLDIPNAYYQLITNIFIIVLIFVIQKIKLVNSHLITAGLILTGFIFYLVSVGYSERIVKSSIKNEIQLSHVLIHWFSSIGMLFLLYQLVIVYRKNAAAFSNAFAWLINIVWLGFLSVECKQLYVSILAGPSTIDKFTAQYLKAGLTILWALYSFVVMWLGMKYKYKTLRIISLTIFSLALLKLFLSDIQDISAGGKIAAFIMLGILLLVISFMYQRLKKIIIDDENKTN